MTCELRDISKFYGEGATAVHALERDRSLGRRRVTWWPSWAPAARARARCLTIAGSLEDPSER